MKKRFMELLAAVAILSSAFFFSFWKYRRSLAFLKNATMSPISSEEHADVLQSGSNRPGEATTIASEFQRAVPREWSVHATGVKTRLATSDKVLALTFDACGGTGSDGYDAKLIDFFKQKHIPATLFVTAKWIAANREAFRSLAAEPLFEIENHGTEHLPCSVSGRSAYGIVGERSATEVANEIETNAENITSITGRVPKFYRAGTAFTDEVCPKIAEKLGVEVVSFGVLGDAGATYSADRVTRALLGALPGSIVILHMNHPEKETAEGVAAAVPLLEKQGFRFVTLSQYPLE